MNRSQLDPRKIQEYLPSLLDRLRDKVSEELHDERARKNNPTEKPVNEAPAPFSMNAALTLAYESVWESSASLSLRG